MSKGFLRSTFGWGWDWLRDIARWFKNPDEQSAVWKDYWRTWETASFMRLPNRAFRKSRTVLIVSVDSPLYEVKQMAMMATGLYRKEWRPVVLLSSKKNRWHRRYFQAHGLDEFLYWDEFCEEVPDSNLVSKFFSEKLDFQDVKQWANDGCWIGPQILSSISRSTFQGAPNVEDQNVLDQLEKSLIEVLARIPVAKQVLDKVRPELMLVIEANYARYAPLTDLAVQREIDVIQIIQPNRDDAFIMRRLNKQTRRQHPSTLSREVFMQLRDQVWTEKEAVELEEVFAARYGGKWFLQARNQPGTRDFSCDEIVSSLGLDNRLKTVVVFSHVLWDANLFFGEDLFKDYGEWFSETVKAAVANQEVNWIIKMHPANAWKRQRAEVRTEYAETVLIRDAVGDLPGHVQLMLPDTDVSTRSLFELADYAVTVRGTVSSEAPCFGVTTLTAGTGRCDRYGFTVDSNSANEYLEKLGCIQKIPRMTEQQVDWAKRHAHTVFCRKPWVFNSWVADFDQTGRKHMLESNLRLNAVSWDEIDGNGDIGLWADWAEISESVDYLSPIN